jgi:hypothetical protein
LLARRRAAESDDVSCTTYPSTRKLTFENKPDIVPHRGKLNSHELGFFLAHSPSPACFINS